MLFNGKPEFTISTATGAAIAEWCNTGREITIDDVSLRINDIVSLKDLLDLYKQYPQFKEALKPEFEKRKRQIIISQNSDPELANLQKISPNGVH